MRPCLAFLTLLALPLGAVDPPWLPAGAPIVFEPNHGQWSKHAQYGARANGFSAAFYSAQVRYSPRGASERGGITLLWSGGSDQRQIQAELIRPGVSNYYLSRTPRDWMAGIPNYGKLRVPDLYPGIDVTYYGNGQELEFDLEVAPGADFSKALFYFDRVSASIDSNGDLVASTEDGQWIHRRPVAYQEIDGERKLITCSFLRTTDGKFGFSVGKYDPTRKLIIDPSVAWRKWLRQQVSTASYASVRGIARDAAGNVFVTGTISDRTFPTTTGAHKTSLGSSGQVDVYLTKLAPDGTTVLFSTFYGSSSLDIAAGLALDAGGNAWLTGTTAGADLALLNATKATIEGDADGYLAKFSPTGALLISTYVGGTRREEFMQIAVDSTGAILLAGRTESYELPTPGAYRTTTAWAEDCFVLKWNPVTRQTVWASFIGGGAGRATIHSMAVGPDGSVLVGGGTGSSNFATVNAIQPTGSGPAGFLIRFASNGASVIFSTYLGGTTSESEVRAVAFDSAGAIYAAGAARGPGFPSINPIPSSAGQIPQNQTNGFLAKLVPSGNAFVYSTHLRSSTGSGFPNAISVDGTGKATVVGVADVGLPTVGAFRAAPEGADGFILTLNAPGDTIVFSSFFGGPWTDSLDALADDGAGNFLVAGVSNEIEPPYPNSAWGPAPFVAKIAIGTVVTAPVTFQTVPPGLKLEIDGATVTTPVILQWAPGTQHSITATNDQVTTGLFVSNFLSWAHGGSRVQSLVAPAAATTYTASFDSFPCVYTADPPVVALGRSFTTALVSITTQPGCPWQPSTQDSWISLGGGRPTTGYGQFTINAAPITFPSSRTGSVQIGNSSLTVTQGATVPRVTFPLSSCCGSNIGATANFLLSIEDPDGSTNLTVTNLLINNPKSGSWRRPQRA